MGNIKLIVFLVLSIILIITGIKYSFYEAGVEPENVYKKRTKISHFNCIDNFKNSDSLDIKFIDINKVLLLKTTVYCKKLSNVLNVNDEVDLWLEKNEDNDFINLWGLAINDKKIIWHPSGLKPKTNINFFSVLLILWGGLLGRKCLELFKLKKKN